MLELPLEYCAPAAQEQLETTSPGGSLLCGDKHRTRLGASQEGEPSPGCPPAATQAQKQPCEPRSPAQPRNKLETSRTFRIHRDQLLLALAQHSQEGAFKGNGTCPGGDRTVSTSKRKDKSVPLRLQLPCSASGAQNHSPWPHFLLLLSYRDAHLQSPALLTLGGP